MLWDWYVLCIDYDNIANVSVSCTVSVYICSLSGVMNSSVPKSSKRYFYSATSTSIDPCLSSVDRKVDDRPNDFHSRRVANFY